jgi:hypothetical protein
VTACSHKSGHQAKDRVKSHVNHVPQRGDDRHPAQFLSLGEAYREGRLKIRFLIEDLDESTLKRNEEISNRADHHVGSVFREQLPPNEATKFDLGKHDGGPDSDDEMVLVAFVENLDGIEIKLPARIRCEVDYLVDDLFRGEVHLSCRDGTTKTLTSTLGEGEANARRVLCLVAHHPEAEMVKRGSEIVDGISQNESEVFWDGMLGLDVNQSLRGVFALPDSKLERLCRKVFGDLPVQVQDVIAGPLDF